MQASKSMNAPLLSLEHFKTFPEKKRRNTLKNTKFFLPNLRQLSSSIILKLSQSKDVAEKVFLLN